MATFLELVKKVASESGTMTVQSVTTAVDRIGRLEKIAGWVQTAWNQLQTERKDWLWMGGELEKALFPGTRRYTAASFSMDRVADWPDEVWIGEDRATRMDWKEFYRTRLVRNDGTGKPTVFAISPKQEMVFSPVPDLAYTVKGLYRKSSQQLTADDDVPEMPERFHDLIVYLALKHMTTHDESFNQKQFWMAEEVRLRNELCRDQLPPIDLGSGGSLA